MAAYNQDFYGSPESYNYPENVGYFSPAIFSPDWHPSNYAQHPNSRIQTTVHKESIRSRRNSRVTPPSSDSSFDADDELCEAAARDAMEKWADELKDTVLEMIIAMGSTPEKREGCKGGKVEELSSCEDTDEVMVDAF